MAQTGPHSARAQSFEEARLLALFRAFDDAQRRALVALLQCHAQGREKSQKTTRTSHWQSEGIGGINVVVPFAGGSR